MLIYQTNKDDDDDDDYDDDDDDDDNNNNNNKNKNNNNNNINNNGNKAQATGTKYLKIVFWKKKLIVNAGYVNILTDGSPNLKLLQLAKSGRLMRHDRVGAHLRYSVCKALGFKTTEKW